MRTPFYEKTQRAIATVDAACISYNDTAYMQHTDFTITLTAGDEGAGHGAQQGLGEVLHHGRKHVRAQLVLRGSTYDHLLLTTEVAQGVALGGAVEVLHHCGGGGVLVVLLLGVEGGEGQGAARVPVQVRQLHLHYQRYYTICNIHNNIILN